MEFAAFEKSSSHIQEFQQSVGQGKNIMGIDSLKGPDKEKVKKLMSGIAVIAPPEVEEDEEDEEEEFYSDEEEPEEEEEEEESEEEDTYQSYSRSGKRGRNNSNFAPSKFAKPTFQPKTTSNSFGFGTVVSNNNDESSDDSDSEIEEAPKQPQPSAFNFGSIVPTPKNSFSSTKDYSKEDAEKYRQRIRNEENLKNSAPEQQMDPSMMTYQMPKFAQLDPQYATRILLTDLSKVEMQLMLARLLKADPKFEGVMKEKLSKILSQRIQ